VILVTGYGSSTVMEKAQTLGSAFYFEKPVSIEILKNALKSLNVV
jgi:ActR/RegA family two-component response regulator